MFNFDRINIASTALSERDKRFFDRIYSAGLEKYINRLSAIGFNERGNFLDAGCGFGQWSIAASYSATNVVGIDVSAERIEAARNLTQDIKNITFQQGSICELPFPDESFDFIFSYSVIYYTNVDLALKELVRVLKPGGKIYICSNGIGWYFYNIIKKPNPSSDFNPQVYGLKSIWCSFLYYLFRFSPMPGGSVFTSISYISCVLKKLGVFIDASGPEGSIYINKLAVPPKNFFPGRFLNFECCSEWLGIKK